MKLFLMFVAVIVPGIVARDDALGADPAARTEKSGSQIGTLVYGEWRIQVRPDKGREYAQLIETKGLPLFREAGGRMVGWWTTLVGDLYEHITIWEYDGMTAFELAGEKLGKDQRFAEFVALRDPLLVGEQSRFLRLTDFGNSPQLPLPGKVVVHEVHRVPLARREAYLRFMQTEGLSLLKGYGFRAVGPWTVGVGSWTEITYLFCYDSLRERDERVAAFASQADARRFNNKVHEFADDVTTRILLPAPFTYPPASSEP